MSDAFKRLMLAYVLMAVVGAGIFLAFTLPHN
jgi:hypothetical protein